MSRSPTPSARAGMWTIAISGFSVISWAQPTPSRTRGEFLKKSVRCDRRRAAATSGSTGDGSGTGTAGVADEGPDQLAALARRVFAQVHVAVLADVLAGGEAGQPVVGLRLELQLGVDGLDHLGHLLARAAVDGERRAAGV